MKIIEIIDTLCPGGAQRFVVDLSNELAKQHKITLITFRIKGDCDFYNTEVSKDIKRIKLKGNWSLISRILQIFTVLKVVLKEKPNVIHAHSLAFLYVILPALMLRNTKVYYTVHNLAENDAGNGVSKYLRRIFLKNIIMPITISQICSNSFHRFYGYKEKAIINNGCRELTLENNGNSVKLEIENYKETSETKILINVARMTEQKNHELLIEAVKELIQDGEDISLLIIGNAPSVDRLEYLKNLAHSKRIHFLGPKHNVSDYLINADYFCLSSKWEGLPISLLEAGFLGCYAVCTPVGGICDVIVDKSIGRISDTLSKSDFKTAIRLALKTDFNKNIIARYYQDKFGMRTCANQYLEVFSSTLE